MELPAPPNCNDPSIAALRAEMGLTLAQFGERIGLASKAQVSLLERGLTPCSLKVALAIEALSGGRIDAAELCEEVRLARHAVIDTAKVAEVSTGNISHLSGGME